MNSATRTLLLALCFLLPNMAYPAEEQREAHHGEDHGEKVHLTESELHSDEFGRVIVHDCPDKATCATSFIDSTIQKTNNMVVLFV